MLFMASCCVVCFAFYVCCYLEFVHRALLERSD